MMPGAQPPEERGQLPLDLGHTASHAEADYSVGAGKRLAHSHITAYPDLSGPLSLITGAAKSGKSHLARIWAERSGAEAPAVDAVEDLARTGGVSPLVLEDVDRLPYEEAALFHLLNQSMRDHRPLLLTARDPVGSWPFRTEDLKSRARLAAHFAVTISDDIQLSQMFVKLFDDRQVTVDPKVIAYLVARMERSAAEAVVLAGMVDRLALARGTAITRALAAEALALRGAAHDDGQLALDLEADDE